MAKKMNGSLGVPSTGMDKSWQAEDDARTLQRAGEVIGSLSRLGAAKKILSAQVKGTGALLGVLTKAKAAGTFAPAKAGR